MSDAGRLINFRASDEGHAFIEGEAARLTELLGRKVTRTDILREALMDYSLKPLHKRNTLRPRKTKKGTP